MSLFYVVLWVRRKFRVEFWAGPLEGEGENNIVVRVYVHRWDRESYVHIKMEGRRDDRIESRDSPSQIPKEGLMSWSSCL